MSVLESSDSTRPTEALLIDKECKYNHIYVCVCYWIIVHTPPLKRPYLYRLFLHFEICSVLWSWIGRKLVVLSGFSRLSALNLTFLKSFLFLQQRCKTRVSHGFSQIAVEETDGQVNIKLYMEKSHCIMMVNQLDLLGINVCNGQEKKNTNFSDLPAVRHKHLFIYC